MNSRRTLVIALATVVVVLGVLAATLGRNPAPTAPLAGAAIGGPFALVDQRGRAFTDRDLKGRYALVYFGYTFCPDVCPLDVQVISQGLAAFEKADPARAAKVVPVFVTVDPERDRPAELAAFAANFHPRLVALTGTQPQVDAAMRAYRIYARRARAGGGQGLSDGPRRDHLPDGSGRPADRLHRP